jgi:hypothetical protein
MTPLNPIVEALVCRLDDQLREAFEERAGIMEFEAGKLRELAEALALLDVIRLHPLAVSDVIVMKVELDGETFSVLTTDIQAAQRHFTDIGAKPVGPVDLSEAVKRMGIAAVLAHLG